MGGRRVHVNALLLRVSLSPQKKLGLQIRRWKSFTLLIGIESVNFQAHPIQVTRELQVVRKDGVRCNCRATPNGREGSLRQRQGHAGGIIISSPQVKVNREAVKQFLPEKSYKKRGWRFLSFRRQAASTATKQRHCLPAKVSGPWLSPDGGIFSSIISIYITTATLFKLRKKR